MNVASTLVAPFGLGAPPISGLAPMPSRRTWNELMTQYERARSVGRHAGKRMDAAADVYAEMTGAHPYKDAAGRRLDATAAHASGYEQASDLAEVCGEHESYLSSKLILTPAPDHAALLWKLEYLYGDVADEKDGFASAWCVGFIEALMSDARRLLANGRA